MSSITSRTRRVSLVLAAVAALLPHAEAQQLATAGIYGDVLDAQGGAIPDARVTLTDIARNQDRVASTNGSGQFAFPLIPIGAYRLRVEKAGFHVFEQSGIVLEVNDNRKIDVTLEVGQISEKVTVEAAPAAVETSNATLKSVIDGKRIVELPLNGRNVASLTGLVAGVVPVGVSAGDSKDPAGASTFSVNGSRQNNIKFTLDGGDNQDNLQNANLPFPFPDAVAEFSVQTSNAGTEIGKSSAGAVNVVTKSGTNEYHGDGFWFIRNTDLNASSYFLHQSDQLKRNQAGGTLGGPIVRNKLFFFAGYQQTWIRTSPTESKTLTMPAAYRTGDFSSLLTQAKPVIVKDPVTGTPFPNNMIPQNRLSPAAEALLKYSPAPGPDGYNHWTVRTPGNDLEAIGRIDYRLSERHSFTARYYQNNTVNSRTIDPNDIHTVSNSESSYSNNAVLGYTFVATPALLSETHASVARVLGVRSNAFPKTIADFGVAVNPDSNQISVSINGTSGLSISTSNPPARFVRTNIGVDHSWNWIKGRHNLSWGVNLMASRYNETNTYQGSGAYGFNGRYSGFDQADYILGLMSSFQQSNGEIEYRRDHYYGFFFGDTFRLTQRLTLTYGLRWEPFFPITDLNDREVQFNQAAYNQGAVSQRYVNAPIGLLYPGDSFNGHTIPKGGVDAGKNQLAPRIGLAWDVTGDGKTSMRLGYGIYYDSSELYLLNNMNLQAPFSFSVSFTDGLFDNPFAGRENLNVFPYAGDFNKNSPFQIPFSAVTYLPTWRQPYTQNWNFTLEHSFASWVAQASYVGTKGTNLVGNGNLNPPIYNYSLTLQQNQSTINQRRPLPQYQDITDLFTGLNSIYNGLQLSLRKRFSHGFSVQTAYTFSKAIDVISKNAQVTSLNVANPFNYNMSRGASDYDRTNVFTGSYVWTLPNPKTPFGARWLGAVIDGWEWSGIVTLATGTPFGINSTNDAMAGAGTPQGLLVGDLSLPSGRSRGAEISQFFNTAAVAQALPGTWGDIGRNVLRNPDSSNVDTRISRIIPLKFRETASLQCLFEAFSALNHPQLAAPDNRLGRSTFGQVTTVNGQRVLQLGLKLSF